ncbi:hypothetical protein LSAT2_010071 [Lamellibrachia satsuma]|nr:hypothetical protein LSAT2_010071 [Lamellibrachia satsuma]
MNATGTQCSATERKGTQREYNGTHRNGSTTERYRMDRNGNAMERNGTGTNSHSAPRRPFNLFCSVIAGTTDRDETLSDHPVQQP